MSVQQVQPLSYVLLYPLPPAPQDETYVKQSVFDRLFEVPAGHCPKEDLFAPGLALCDFIQESSSLFSSLYLVQFTSCTLLGTLALYSASAVIFVSDVKPLQIVNTVTFFIFGLHFVLRMVGSAHFGQVGRALKLALCLLS